ncbi:RluA family pseudouridine synthase [Rhabdochlamydiaceae symbiont of Dictyostelium giganteum]|uniref:RluA family pseudouridine synthase n=1 Tax=Rhabdochlamydiaceae symbiont of Dictyostelium giganteum TaxID=3342349 RepID=UPI00384B6B7C
MSMNSFVNESFVILEAMQDIRLDKLLVQTYPHHSRTYFQYLIEKGLVLVNGEIIKKREKLSLDDEVEVCFELKPELSLEKENIPLDILYEDAHMIAVNKPAGMVIHPAPGHPSQTFVNALLYHCQSLPDTGNLRPGIVHRLDKDTSGVLLAAKTREAHIKLVEAFALRQITKNYITLCHGNPGVTTVREPIKRNTFKRQQMCVDPSGRPAISLFKPLEVRDDLTWTFVTLITGRTHQIRVHLKHIKTPVLGDAVYGHLQVNEKYKVKRQLLHAYEVFLSHPITGEKLHIRAPLPSDMQQFDPPKELI